MNLEQWLSAPLTEAEQALLNEPLDPEDERLLGEAFERMKGSELWFANTRPEKARLLVRAGLATLRRLGIEGPRG